VGDSHQVTATQQYQVRCLHLELSACLLLHIGVFHLIKLHVSCVDNLYVKLTCINFINEQLIMCIACLMERKKKIDSYGIYEIKYCQIGHKKERLSFSLLF